MTARKFGPARGGRIKAFAAAAVIALVSASALAADPQIASFNDAPDPVPAGGLVTYSARIDNSAVDAAVNVRVVVPVTAGATFVSASAPCVMVAGSVECNLGSVAGSGTDIRNLAFVFRANGDQRRRHVECRQRHQPGQQHPDPDQYLHRRR